jgi:hypothetical protein
MTAFMTISRGAGFLEPRPEEPPLLAPPDEPPLRELPDDRPLLEPPEELFELLPLREEAARERPEPEEPFLELPFDFASATFIHLVVACVVGMCLELGFLGGALARHGKPVEEVALYPLPLLVPDRSAHVVHLELQELALDVVLVVELAVGLVRDLLGHPRRASHGSQR